jgi:PAS domain S-box-containing protein
MKISYEDLERKVGETAEVVKGLKEKLAFHEMIIDKSVDMYFLQDLKGRFVYLPGSKQGLLGFTPEEAMTVNFTDIIEKRDIPGLEQIHRDILSVRATVSFEVTVLKKDKTPLPLELKEWPWVEDQVVKGICGIVRDVSQRKKTEEALRDQKEKFQRIAENTGDVVWVYDLGERLFTYVSPSVQNMTGYNMEEARNANARGRIDEEHREAVQRLFSRGFEDYGIGAGNGKYPDEERLEWREYRRDGTLFWAESILSVIRDDAGMAVEILGVSRDITDRKELETDLGNRNVFIETIMDNLPMGLFVYKISDGTPIYTNKENRNVYGWTIEELGNVDEFFEKSYPDPVERERLRQRENADIASRDPSRMKWENIKVMTASGEKKIINGLNIPLFEQELMIATVQDVTAMKRLEEQLGQAWKMESIATLAGGIAHQFNNALSIITGYLGIMKLDPPAGGGINDFLPPMEKYIRKMGVLTEQLLAYAKGGKYMPGKAPINELIRETLVVFEASMGPGISLHQDLSCRHLNVEVDETQVKAALSAILDNAVESISGKGQLVVSCKKERITEEVAEELPGSAAGDYAWITVADNGVGMDEETRNRIFDPFFTTKAPGRGLGMAAVHGIIQNHDGWVTVNSEPAKGTEVHIYLPAV